MTDIVVTWPKKRPLASYLAELELAKRDGKVINFRVPRLPGFIYGVRHGVTCIIEGQRCFRVHDGRVRGWVPVLTATYRGANEVARVQSDSFAGFWPAGYYVVCSPIWHEVPREKQVHMPGFRGFRYFDRTTLR